MHKRKTVKILFLAPYPVAEPVTRFRIIQYFEFYKKEGIDPHFSSFLSARAYRIKNKAGILAAVEKIMCVLFACLKRFCQLLFLRKYDVVYISKEAFPFGPPFLEYVIKRICPNFIYDFDDAVFAYPESRAFSWRRLWEDKERVSKIIRMSSIVIAGNQFLADYALNYNHNVHIVHTPIDTRKYYPKTHTTRDRVVIGWVGTWFNVQYLFLLKNVFIRLAAKYDYTLNIVGPENIVDVKFEGVNMRHNIWCLRRECELIQDFDIGIMPLKDTDWERGKCGFKIIQYMAVGIPCVASPVGMNKDIIRNNINGLLASDNEQWYRGLSLLIEDHNLRKIMGVNARSLAEEFYATNVVAPKLSVLLKGFQRDNDTS